MKDDEHATSHNPDTPFLMQSALTRMQARPDVRTPTARAAVVVEDRYSQVFAQAYVRPAVVADGLAELQVAFPNVPVIFCETRALAEEWTYRFLAATRHRVMSEAAAQVRVEIQPQLQPTTTRPSRSRPRLRCAPGPAGPDWRCPIGGDCGQRSGPLGSPRTVADRL